MTIIEEIIEKHLQRDHNNFIVGINSVPLANDISEWGYKEYEQGLKAGKIIMREQIEQSIDKIFAEFDIRGKVNPALSMAATIALLFIELRKSE